MTTWITFLGELFSATVNQQTLEEAVELMLLVSGSNREYHRHCVETLDLAIAAAKRGNEAVIPEINRSGYRVASAEEALRLLTDFRQIYLSGHEQL